MRISCSPAWAIGPVGLFVAALLSSPVMSERARAYGGLWSSQADRIHQSATQIIFVDNPGSTVTAVVQLEYSGPAKSFAWLIPVPGTPTVEVSSRTVFERLDAATAPQYWVEVAVEGECMRADDAEAAKDAGTGMGGAPSVIDGGAAPVELIEQSSVGPYDYVNLVVDPTLDDPAEVATDWLTSNGYDLSGLDAELLGPYLKKGLNLLAIKLTSGAEAEVGAIRPVSLTYEGKLPVIPIRPSAVAAQDDMGLQIWVIGPSQAVPVSYKSLVLNDARIDWSSSQTFASGTLPAGGVGPFGPLVRKPRNYDAVVSAAADEADGQGFVTELGGPASQYRDAVWSPLDEANRAMIASQSYADGIDAVVAVQAHYGVWDGFRDAVEGASTLPDDLAVDDFVRDPAQYRGVVEVDTAELFRLLDERVIGPVADTAALFYRGPYLTRLYSTMSPDEMTVDPAFDYNPELAQVGSVHIARQLIECSPTLSRADAPWRMELPQGGVVVGEGGRGWPVDADSMPANLEIVELSTTGSGTVVKDNRQLIEAALRESAGATSRGGGCGVSYVAARTGSAPVPWLSLAGALFFARRRRRPRRPVAA